MVTYSIVNPFKNIDKAIRARKEFPILSEIWLVTNDTNGISSDKSRGSPILSAGEHPPHIF